MQQQAGGLLIGNLATDNADIFGMASRLKEAQEDYIRLEKEKDAIGAAALRATMNRYASEINEALRLDDILTQINARYKDKAATKETVERAKNLQSAMDAMSGANGFTEQQALAMQIRQEAEKYGLSFEALSKFKLNTKEGIASFVQELERQLAGAQINLQKQLHLAEVQEQIQKITGVSASNTQIED